MLTKEVNLASVKSDIDDLDINGLDNDIKMMLSKELYMLNWLKRLLLFNLLIPVIWLKN